VKLNPEFSMAKAAVNSKKNLFTRKLDLNLKKTLVKCHIRNIVLYGAKTRILRKVDHKYRNSFKRLCWRGMKKISWNDRVKTEQVLYRVKVERNIVRTIQRKKVSWVCHILCRICLIKHIIEGKIERGLEVTERQGKIRKQLLEVL
jgi:hypothetical protein